MYFLEFFLSGIEGHLSYKNPQVLQIEDFIDSLSQLKEQDWIKVMGSKEGRQNVVKLMTLLP